MERVLVIDKNDVSITVCVSILSMMVVVLIHEVAVSRCQRQPACAICLPGRAWWLRWVLLLAQCQNFVEATTFIPLSYDLASALGTSSPSVFSGLLVGLLFFAFAPGGRLAIKTLPESDWHQPQVRRRLLYAYALDVLSQLAIVAFFNFPEKIPSRSALFWVLVVLRTFSGICIGYTMLGAMLLGQRITPPSLRADFSILTQIMRNSGFMIGPGLCSVVLWSYHHFGVQATIFEQAAGSAMALAASTTLVMLLFALAVPLDAPIAEDGAEAAAGTGSRRRGEERLEDYPDAVREKVVWLLVTYGVERAFTIAGVEVATAMMLETVYGWSVEACGFVLTVLAGISAVGCMVLLSLLRCGLLYERSTLFSLAAVSIVGGVFLFQLPQFGWESLLVADVLIYCAASVANGLAEGWAMRAVKPDTSFSNEARMKVMVISMTLARLVSPAISRGLIALAGRNSYALLQLVLIISGFVTVARVCWTVKAHKDSLYIPLKEDVAAVAPLPDDKTGELGAREEAEANAQGEAQWGSDAPRKQKSRISIVDLGLTR